MGRLRRLAPLAAAVVAVAGCGGGGDTKPTAGATPTAKASPTPNPDELIRWPRFWATRDNAERGSEPSFSTKFWAGYDEHAIVYNGQDVVRTLKPDTGKPIGRVVLPSGRYICAASARRQISGGVAVFLVGSLVNSGGGTCDRLIGISTKTGKQRWSFKLKGQDLGTPTLDERDGRVLLSEAPRLTVLEARTGKVVWQRSARGITEHRGRDSSFPCSVRSALAADAPVVVVFPDNCENGIGYQYTKIHGLDFATGKRRWTSLDTRSPEVFSPDDEQPHPLDGRFIGAIGDYKHRKQPEEALFVDSRTGKPSQYADVDVVRNGETDQTVETCDDSGTLDGGTWDYSACSFVAGGHRLVVQTGFGKRARVTITAQDLATGDREWVYRRTRAQKGKYDSPDYKLLGLNDARTEFWLTDGQDANVERIDVATGKRVGRGRLAPPMDLPRFAVVGPGFVVVRGSAGSELVRSGLDFYRTEAAGD